MSQRGQSHQQRKAARPAWARFKNKKKELRRRQQAGLISAEERARLQEIAKQQYLDDPDTPPGVDRRPITPEERRRIAEIIAEHPGDGDGGEPCGNEWCMTARETNCHCKCEGRWHGCVTGLPPKPKFTRKDCIVCGAEFTPLMRTQIMCGDECRDRWHRTSRVLVSRLRRHPTRDEIVAELRWVQASGCAHPQVGAPSAYKRGCRCRRCRRWLENHRRVQAARRKVPA